MDVMLQRHCARYIYVVPDGLRELMSDISREVLRTQPEDIYTFIADYLDALMITRENARVAAKFVQELSECAETIVELLEKGGMSREEADRVATIIQRHFRAYIERKGILKESDEKVALDILEEAQIPEAQAELAAIVIQNSFRNFKLRREKQKELLSGVIDWRIAARSAIKLYRRTGVSVEEAKRAANLIKAAYRGYYTRRTLMRLKEETARFEDEEGREDEESVEEEEMSSSDSESGGRKKNVRIDYSSVVPHVDFEEPDMMSEQSEQHSPHQISSAEAFVKELLFTAILSPIGEEKEPEGEVLLQEETFETIPEDTADDTAEIEGGVEMLKDLQFEPQTLHPQAKAAWSKVDNNIVEYFDSDHTEADHTETELTDHTETELTDHTETERTDHTESEHTDRTETELTEHTELTDTEPATTERAETEPGETTEGFTSETDAEAN